MARRPTYFLLHAALVAIGLAGLCWYVAPGRGQTPVQSSLPVKRTMEPQFMGAASCASAACHHGNGPQGSWRSEYTTWALFDPHARAYEVLHNDLSRQITTALKAKVPAHENPLCLNCHVQPGILYQPRHERFALHDGVSCEACHGAAEKWLHLHHRTPGNSTALGMRDTKNLRVRAELCAACHVGQPGNEVGHDLIAAGHPVLRFELAAYLANYPRHWKEKQGNENDDFEARAWLVGQLASAKTSVQCLTARAADKEARWPDLADFDCFACHHDLQANAWRQNKDHLTTRRPGTAPFNQWYTGTLGTLADVTETKTAAAYDQLKAAMSRLAPNQTQAEACGKELVRELDKQLTKATNRTFSKDELIRMRRQLATRLRGGEASTWDQAAQLYLGLAAMHVAAPESSETGALLREMKQRLDFPPAHDSPRDFLPVLPRRNP